MARAAAENMIPTTTGAAKAVCLVVLPELKGKFKTVWQCVYLLQTYQLLILVAELDQNVTAEEFNADK